MGVNGVRLNELGFSWVKPTCCDYLYIDNLFLSCDKYNEKIGTVNLSDSSGTTKTMVLILMFCQTYKSEGRCWCEQQREMKKKQAEEAELKEKPK